MEGSVFEVSDCEGDFGRVGTVTGGKKDEGDQGVSTSHSGRDERIEVKLTILKEVASIETSERHELYMYPERCKKVKLTFQVSSLFQKDEHVASSRQRLRVQNPLYPACKLDR